MWITDHGVPLPNALMHLENKIRESVLKDPEFSFAKENLHSDSDTRSKLSFLNRNSRMGAEHLLFGILRTDRESEIFAVNTSGMEVPLSYLNLRPSSEVDPDIGVEDIRGARFKLRYDEGGFGPSAYLSGKWKNAFISKDVFTVSRRQFRAPSFRVVDFQHGLVDLSEIKARVNDLQIVSEAIRRVRYRDDLQ